MIMYFVAITSIFQHGSIIGFTRCEEGTGSHRTHGNAIY
jgi:hypothetical protein